MRHCRSQAFTLALAPLLMQKASNRSQVGFRYVSNNMWGYKGCFFQKIFNFDPYLLVKLLTIMGHTNINAWVEKHDRHEQRYST